MSSIIIWAICICSLLFRLYVYFKGFSFWGDEGALALNLINRNYLELFKGLDYLQVAPPMFLVMSKFLFIDSMRDFILRLIPLVSGIAAIPLFYNFLKDYTRNKKVIWASMFLFGVNLTAIFYCAQFKQYSLELLISVILISVFYKVIFQNSFRWYYSLIILLAPWFSLSSLLITGSYFLIVLFKSRKHLLKIYIPFFLSFVVFYFLSLKSVSSCNYEGMHNWWENGYGFLDFHHPTRLAVRLGELFVSNNCTKIASVSAGGMVLLALINSIVKKNIFIFLPIVLTFAASALQFYPLQARLILFLLPLFVIVIAEYDWKFKNVYLISVCIISMAASTFYLINPYKYYTITDAKKAVQMVERDIKSGEKIILDSTFYNYAYYISDYKNAIILSNPCHSQSSVCEEEFALLPDGKYYLLLKDSSVELPSSIKVIKEYELHSTLIYFKKGFGL